MNKKICSLIFAFIFTLGIAAAESSAQKKLSPAALRLKLINYAMDLRGTPYRYGGTNPRTGLDCSAFIQFSVKESINVNLPRTADAQYKYVKKISRKQLVPGDLVFFRSSPVGKIDHAGIYLGAIKTEGFDTERELFISCQSTGRKPGVSVNALDNPYWSKVFYCGGRFLPVGKKK